MNQKRSSYLLLLVLFSFLAGGCDFTSPVQRDILKAQAKIGEQQYSEAIQIYRRVLGKSSNPELNVKVHFQLGILYSTYMAKYNLGIEHFDKILSISENPLWQVKALEKIGELSFNFTKDFHKSAKSYERLGNYKPKLAESDFYEFRQSESYLLDGKIDQAKNILGKILSNRKHKFYKDALFLSGLARFKEQNWEEAISFWKRYLTREKSREKITQALFLIANTYETIEKLGEAYKIYYSILGDYPNQEVIKERMKSLYDRRVARKR